VWGNRQIRGDLKKSRSPPGKKHKVKLNPGGKRGGKKACKSVQLERGRCLKRERRGGKRSPERAICAEVDKKEILQRVEMEKCKRLKGGAKVWNLS